MMPKGVIFLVPVPIGNLGDITLRAIETLKRVEIIACEDTRKSAFLLSQYEITIPKLISFHKFNERSREELIFSHLESGKDVAIISDAGSPAISDPAQSFVSHALEKGFEVQALPGATALIPAISVSGFSTDAFQFLGFLPQKQKLRQEALRQILGYPFVSIIYESVHRIKDTLAQLAEIMPTRNIAIVREISKLHEEVIRGSAKELAEKADITLKGEFVIVVDKPEIRKSSLTEEELLRLIEESEAVGKRALAHEIALKTGMGKNEVYEMILRLKK